MSQVLFNGTKQIINVPANTAAFIPIVATGPLRFLEIIESVLTATGTANVPQGLDYKVGNDQTVAGFTTLFATVAPTAALADAKPAMIVLGDPMAKSSRHGTMLGNGQDDMGAGAGSRPATVLLMIRSATGTGTAVEVNQYY